VEVEGEDVRGTYCTAVGGAKGPYALGGRRVSAPSRQGEAVGFVVAWTNDEWSSQSATTWSGQYQVVGGAEVLHTTWLLTRETDPAEDWQSSFVGQDVFTREGPSSEEALTLLRRGPRSHPVP
jgi:hypothetical protein